MIKQTIAAALVLGAASLAACGGAPTDEQTEQTGTVEQGLTCPVQIACPGPQPGYSFLYSININYPQISCVYKQTQGSQTYSVTLYKPTECPFCCPSIYCPDPRYNKLTYWGIYNCSAS